MLIIMLMVLQFSATTCGLATLTTSRLYRSIFSKVCFLLDYTPPMIAKYTKVMNEIMCATTCSMNNRCFVYHFNYVNNTCLLFPIIVWAQVVNMSFILPGACKTSMSEDWKLYVPHGGRLFTNSGTFTVPDGIVSLRIVAVGGGGGALFSNSGGGGSGYVTFKNISAVPAQQYLVTVGSGGLGSNATRGAATNGEASSFGDLVIANGGLASNSRFGNGGGSGGGGGANFSILSGSGSSCGGSGSMSGDGMLGGSGQGPTYNDWFSNFKYATFTCGSGGQGILAGTSSVIGGGGGGGILVNGTGPESGGNLSTNNCTGPASAVGYGAGGSAGCYSTIGYLCKYNVNGSIYYGGFGANGLVYVEY